MRLLVSRLSLLLLLLPGLAWARSTVEVSADRSTIGVADQLRLTVKVTSEGRKGGDLEAPPLADWQVVGQFQSQSTSYINGKKSKVTNLQLMLRPTRQGKLKVGAFSLRGGGRVWKSTPLEIVVGAGSAAQAQPNASSDPPSEEVPDRAAFLKWEVSDPELWLGEQFEARLFLYVNRSLDLRSNVSLGDINLEGFWVQDRGQRGRASRRIVHMGGESFTRMELQHYQLVSTRAGELELPELSSEFRLGRGFGNRQNIKRTAPALMVPIKALPTAGRPKNFGGAVGRVTVQLSTDRTKIDIEDGVQLTITTRVEGQIEKVPEIELPALPEFKVHPPTSNVSKAKRGSKRLGSRQQSWLLRPRKTGRLRIPGVSVSYFDPKTGTYKRAKAPPRSITVTGKAGAKAPASVLRKGKAAKKEGLSLRSVRKDASLGSPDRPAYAAPWFLLLLFGMPAGFIGLIARDRITSARSAGAGSRAARRAGATAKAALTGAKNHSAVAAALIGYLETRFEASFRGLTHARLGEQLAERSVSKETIADLVAELENCDYARYAAGAGGGLLAESVARSERIIDAIEGLS